MKYIVANWKAHFDLKEMHNWIRTFSRMPLKKCEHYVEIILCPPSPFISLMNELLYEPFIKIGAQDVSQFPQGSYTGEVTAASYEGLVDYAIIGHSERRKHLKETDDIIQEKCERAFDSSIEPILCVRDNKDLIHKKVNFVAYEPVGAIGNGDNMPFAEVIAMKKHLKLSPDQKFLYGGSVHPENAAEYLASDEIDGVLVGGSTLKPDELFDIALAART